MYLSLPTQIAYLLLEEFYHAAEKLRPISTDIPWDFLEGVTNEIVIMKE